MKRDGKKGLETTREEARALWSFSLATYDAPGVASACIALQDRHGLDVNLLLFCCWAGAQGHQLTTAKLKRLQQGVAGWQQEVVQPLRRVRRRLKGEPGDDAQDLRARILELEIESERQEQLRLADLMPLTPGEAEPRRAGANLRLYMELKEIALEEDTVAELAALMTGAFPDLPPLLAVWFILP
jgi:uncharacterized protein (TIGR02444 family)